MRSPSPSRLFRTRKCPRCGMRYSKNASSCTHCTNLDDDQLRMLKARHNRRAAGKDHFDRLLLFIAVLIVIVMLIINL